MTTQTFRIVIRTDGGRRSQQAFQQITNSANNTGRAVNRTVNVMVNGMGRAERSVRGVRREMNGLSRSSVPLAARIGAMMRSFVIPGAAATSLRNWGRAARGLAGAFAGMYVGRQLMEAADAGTRLTNTLRGFGATESGLKMVRQRIFEISNEARVSANETATLFGRLTLATSNLGLTQEEVLGMTKTMSQALQLSGSSGLEASQSIRQLSQAFNKGKLDGDEFRSVLENAPIITKLLTDELQISKNMLYDWAASGKITVRTLVRAFRNGEKAIDADFQRLERTIGSALIQMYNDFIAFMTAFDERTDISKKMIAGIDLIRNHFDDLAKTLKVVLGYYVAMSATSYVNKMVASADAAKAAALAAAAQPRVSALVGAGGYIGATNALMSRPGPVLAESSRGIKDVLMGLTGVSTVVSLITRAFIFLLSPIRAIFMLVRALLTPWRLFQIAVVAVVAEIGGGFLDALSHALGTTGKIETLFKLIKLSVRAIAHQITAAFRTVGRFVSAMFDSIVESIKVAADFIYALVAALGNTVPAIAANMGNIVKKTIDPLGLLFDDSDYEKSAKDITDTFRNEFNKLRSEKLGRKIIGDSFSAVRDVVSGVGASMAESVSGFLAPEERVMRYEDAFESLRQKVLDTKSLIEKVQKLDLKRLGYEDDEAALVQLEGLLQQISNVERKFDPSMNEQIAEQMRVGGESAAKIMNSIESFTTFLSRSTTVLSEIEALARASQGAEDDVRQSLSTLNEAALAEGVSPQARLAAEQMAAEVNGVLVNKAYEIGNNVFAAFMSGFGGALGNIANELGNRVLPTLYGGVPGGGQDLSIAMDMVGNATNYAKDNLAAYKGELGQLTEKMQQFQTSGMNAMDKVGSAAQGTASQMERFFQQTFGNLEDALVDFVTTGEFDFKKFINAVIADLARLFIRMLIIQPMMNMMGFGMLGFRSGGLVPKVPGYATGGLIGGVGSSTSDRYLAAVSPGEFMMNAAATRRNYPDLVRMNNGGEPRRHSSSSSSQTINFAPQVTVVNDGGSNQGGQEQGEQIATLIQQSFIEMIAREQRQGGLLASTAPRGFA